MISLDLFKKKLGKSHQNLSDVEAERIMKLQYNLANTLFDLWVKKTRITKVDTVIVTNKKNGNCIAIFNFGINYAH